MCIRDRFYKYDCQDIFFDILCPELNLKGIVFFFQCAFKGVSDIVSQYFGPTEASIRTTGAFESLEGPIMSVLRKSYQTTYQDITRKVLSQGLFGQIIQEIQNQLQLGSDSPEAVERILEFLKKLAELLLIFYISDPPVYVNIQSVGSYVSFNPIVHDVLDGFVKPKEECVIVLPATHKNHAEGELLNKALVLSLHYEIPN
eukprot:TRINITY_DN2614_c0_g1_i4.p1 TRINITY_DN2614_c0_g1~~TRINITY_DN2614_c0_g1_i4.p1  ORF type:complete len:201 (+),score=16.55 TRINITY_DN2614_c0_g1_i4:65-667(+)